MHRRIKGDLLIRIVIVVFMMRAIYMIYLAVSSAMAYPLGSFDFQWDSAKLLSERINPYLESLYHNTAYNGQYDMFYGIIAANQFPSMLILLFPFTILGPCTAKLAWLVFNLVFSIIMLIEVRRTIFKDISSMLYVLVALIMLCGMPWQVCIGNGQHSLFSCCFFVLAIAAMGKYGNTRNGNVLAGILLSIAYFKYTITIPLCGYFIYKKWYKPIVISVIPHVVLTAWSGWWLNENFMEMIIQPIRVAGALQDEGFADFAAMIPNKVIYLIVAVVLVGISIFRVYHARGCVDIEIISLLMVAALLIVYHRIYDYFILYIPMAYFINHLVGGLKIGQFRNVNMLCDIVCVMGIWMIFFKDTVLNKVGIVFETSLYQRLCFMAMCFLYICLFYRCGGKHGEGMRDG